MSSSRDLQPQGVYDEGARTAVSLSNTKGRKVWIEKPERGRFYTDYKTPLGTIQYTKKYSKEDLTTRPKEFAFEVIIYICDRFRWHQPSVEVIEKEQDNLLTRQI